MAQYIKDPINGEISAIKDGIKHIPLDPANTDYAELMRQVAEEGLIIEDADE